MGDSTIQIIRGNAAEPRQSGMRGVPVDSLVEALCAEAIKSDGQWIAANMSGAKVKDPSQSVKRALKTRGYLVMVARRGEMVHVKATKKA